MAATINTNIASINAQRNLALSGQSLNTTMQRLSSGLRVNSAKDDAAGLAIAERMNTQVKGLTVAARNANDGISLAQTAEGALGKVGDMLQRMRELAVQASNATNSDSDRVALQAEVKQLAAEIDRVAKQTNFNGQKILDGSFAGAVFQVGANSGDNVTLGALADTRSSQISTISYAQNTVTFTTTDTPIRAIAEFDQAIALNHLSITVGTGADAFEVPLEGIPAANSSLERLGQVLTATNNKTADTGVTAYMTRKDGTNEYSIEFMSERLDGDGKPVDIKFNNFTGASTGIGGTIATDAPPASYLTALDTASDASPFNANDFDKILAKVVESNPALLKHTGIGTTYTTYTGNKTQAAAQALETALATAADAYKNTNLASAKTAYDNVMANPNALLADKTNAALAYQTAINTFTGSSLSGTYDTTANFDAQIPDLESAANAITHPSDLNITALDHILDARGIEDIDVTTQEGAWIALKKIDSAIDQVNGARATLGAMQTRFENAVNNIDIQVENLSAARGRIVDADFAVETANLSRTQILQQAGTAMVAQANQIPQNVLQLLQG